ncbi:MAG TPA: energy-coupling factor transporter transmembrane component T [Acidimicrobiales bacterium]|nr:energy-coupling factor transporter transmembrane component T [Acidimicrobiales bacterium]
MLLRVLPWPSPVRGLWAGTKLVAVVALAAALSFEPTWPTIGVIGTLLFVTARLARVPRSAVPRPPLWFWLITLAGAALTVASGSAPYVTLGPVQVGFGDLELYVRFSVLAALLLGGSALVAWTTDLGEVAPALARLWAPLRWLRLPVDEWAVVVALTVRSLPLLFEELRTLLAARRLRGRAPTRTLDSLLEEAIDLMTAALAASVRRAGEMGEAITARGGTGTLAAVDRRPGRADAAALGAVALAIGASVGANLL